VLRTGTWGSLSPGARKVSAALCPVVVSSGDAFELFGSAVSVDGNRIAVGAYAGVPIGAVNGAVYIFDYDGSTWQQTARLTSSDGRGADA